MDKPTFRVTQLVYCPSPIHSEKAEVAMKRGSMNHVMIQEWMKERGVEVEVPLRVERENYVLIGHADGIDFNNGIIYEIKPNERAEEFTLQLSAYIAMAKEMFKRDFQGALVFYRGNQISTQYIIPIPNALEVLDKVALALIQARQWGKLLVKHNIYCKYCERVDCPVRNGIRKMALVDEDEDDESGEVA